MKQLRLLLVLIMIGLLGGCELFEPPQPVEPQPVVNIKRAQVSKSEKPKLTREQIESAIIEAADSQGWKIDPARMGLFIASRRFKDQEAVIDILYGTKVYSINYQSSENFNAHDGQIAPQYNQWVIALNQAIKAKLAQTESHQTQETEVIAANTDKPQPIP